jgi:hypothetical protein
MILRSGILLGIVCFLAGCANTAAPFRYDHKYGLVSEEGRVIVPPEFKYMGDFDVGGLLLVESNENYYGFMDTKGHLAIPPRFEDVNHAGFVEDNLARVKENGQWGDLDHQGNFFPLAKDGKSAHPESLKGDDSKRHKVKEFKENNKFGLVDAAGKVLLPPRFDGIGRFSRAGLANFTENGKEGLINDRAEIMIPPEFDAITTFHGVSAWAKKEGRQGYINQRGKFIFQYSETCGVPTIINRWNKIIWPPLSEAQICAESRKLSVNQARPGDILHLCAEAPFPEKDALCRIRIVDSHKDEILVEYQETCTSQYRQGDQNWQFKGKIMPLEERALCESSKTFCFSC